MRLFPYPNCPTPRFFAAGPASMLSVLALCGHGRGEENLNFFLAHGEVLRSTEVVGIVAPGQDPCRDSSSGPSRHFLVHRAGM